MHYIYSFNFIYDICMVILKVRLLAFVCWILAYIQWISTWKTTPNPPVIYIYRIQDYI